MKSKSSDLLTMPEAGEELRCTASQVRKLVRDGVLAGEKCCFKILRLRRNALAVLAEDGNVSILHVRAETAAHLHKLATTRGETADDLADRLLSNALASGMGDGLVGTAAEPPQVIAKESEKTTPKRKKGKKKKEK